MSNQIRQLDPATIENLRNMARQGRSASEMVRELRRCLEPEAYIVMVLNYFREAFRLTLADVKPIAAFTRNKQREIENEARLDALLVPAILKHREDWDIHDN